MDVYEVEKGDNFTIIAEKFDISLDELIQANPQIKNINRLFPGDKIKIPKKIKKQIPQIITIEFLDENRQPLPRVGEFIQLQPVTIIRVTFSVEVASVLFFFFPTGVDTFEFTQLIGAVRNGRIVEFRWDVPPALLAFFFVIGCTNSACIKSEDIGVFSEE
ncbi:MAG: LysM peptidoglycan-binding domain-containing protein [Candidatus Syntrophonatronum acetioxidans]|uniref:LysM peptidoglycan-binding domain-containing protein n=1 Tax=Candidatus Syntrophonatronum acetioxidans TaxID=1795816 RepID=A0A424YGH3_9FIRM|nr:MAG: LysM peptidoglycan-binding domain-containing protein [Candidatus Syntrophonatronum acetioxidans]